MKHLFYNPLNRTSCNNYKNTVVLTYKKMLFLLQLWHFYFNGTAIFVWLYQHHISI